MPLVRRGQLVGRRVVVGLAVVVVAVCLSGMVAYRLTYGTFAFWADPPRISWCGRDYLPSPGATLSHAAAGQQPAVLVGDQPYSLAQVATVPPVVGDPVLASVIPQATRDRLHLPCAMVIYLQTGPDSYRPYVLSGGP